MKKITWIILFVIAGLFIVAGCTKTDLPSTPAPTATAAPTPLTLVYTDYPARGVYNVASDGSGNILKTSGKWVLSNSQKAVNGSYLLSYYDAASPLELGIYDSAGTYLSLSRAANEFEVDLSKDGSKVVYSVYVVSPGCNDIFTMNADGTGNTRLTYSLSGQYKRKPQWSHDGTKIAYVNTNSSELVVMNSNGTGEQTLAMGAAGFVIFTSWAPGGEYLAAMFQDDNANNKDRLFLIKADGTQNATTIIETPMYQLGPVYWLSDDYIYYDREQAGVTNVWKIKADGTGNTRVTNAVSGAAAMNVDYWG